MGASDYASLEERVNTIRTKDPNKRAVYLGHKKYEVIIDGVTHHIYDDMQVSYDGKVMTGEQLYDLFTSTNR